MNNTGWKRKFACLAACVACGYEGGSMNGILQKLQADIPDYQVFLTLAEMDKAMRQLAAEHSDCVSLLELGKTTEYFGVKNG